MSVTAQVPRNVSTAAPGATVFPYGFKILDKTDLRVQVDGVVKEVDVDYTVSGVGAEEGGSVTFVTPMAGGEVVSRRRAMPLQRLNDYQQLGDLRSDTLNQEQDAPIMMLQQLDEAIGRALTIREELASTVSTMLPDPDPSKVLGWALDGLSLRNVDLSGPADLLLRSDLLDSAGGTAIVTYRRPGAGTVNRSLRAKLGEMVSVTDFSGADPTGITDSTAAFTAALAAANEVYVPPGTYLISATNGFTIPAGKVLRGAGRSTILKRAAGVPAGNTYTISMSSFSRLENLVIDGNGDNQTNIHYQVLGFGIEGAVCRGVVIKDGYGVGIGWSTSKNCVCIDCEATGMRRIRSGFWNSAGDGGHRYINCYSHHNHGDGLVIDSPNCYVEGGEYSYCGIGNPDGYGGAIGAAGIFTEGGKTIDGLTIIGVKLFGNGESGMDIGATKCIIKGVISAYNQLSGIMLKNGSHYTVAENICFNNGWYAGAASNVRIRAGIAVLPPVSRLTLQANVCYETRTGGDREQQWGIYFSNGLAAGGNSTDWVVGGNVCQNNITGPDNINPGVTGQIYSNLTALTYNDFRSGEAKRIQSASATPSVAYGVRIIHVTGPTTITSIADGAPGQMVTLVNISGTVTITHNAAAVSNPLHLAGGTNATLNAYGENITLLRMPDGHWYETGRVAS